VRAPPNRRTEGTQFAAAKAQKLPIKGINTAGLGDMQIPYQCEKP
jgi:hypothetical protein